MNSPFPNRNAPLRAASVTTTIGMVPLFSFISPRRLIFRTASSVPSRPYRPRTRQQLRGFGLARVLTNAVPIARHLGEALSGAISNGRPIIDRTSDRSFEDGCVDESRLGMRVGRRRPAGTNFDEHTLDTFARHILQSVLVDE